jgi:hypothetical protein
MKTKRKLTTKTVGNNGQAKQCLIVKKDPFGEGSLIIEFEDDGLLYNLLAAIQTPKFAELIKTQGKHYKFHFNNLQKSHYAYQFHQKKGNSTILNCSFFYNEIIPLLFIDMKSKGISPNQFSFPQIFTFLSLYVNIYIDEIVESLQKEN